MEKMNNELIEKAKQANSAEEIAALAKENGVEMTEEQAKTVYEKFHPVSGEIEDDELENVAGGGCGESTNSDSKYECPECHCHSKDSLINYNGIVACGSCGYIGLDTEFIKK